MAHFKIIWSRNLCINIQVILAIFLFAVFLWNHSQNSCHENEQPLRLDHLLDTNRRDLLACSAIFRGDTAGVEETDLIQLLAAKKRDTFLTEAFYLNLTQDCSAYVKNRGFLTVTLSEEEKHFPIAYSMVIHEKIEMFERLLRAVYVPHNVYCVHVDQKSSEDFKNAVRAIVSCFPNVFVASRLENVVYASWSRVQADLNCMEDLLKSPVQWKYLLNTCGTDFPIKTNAEIVQNLRLLNGKNSMESEETSEHKKDRWRYHYNITNTVARTSIKKSPPPISTPMFSGNAYFVVTREFVRHIFESKEVLNLLEWAKDTYSPDEFIWATLFRMPAMPGSYPPNSKFQQSDMNALARLVKWSYLEGDVRRGAPYPPCTGVHQRAVCIFGAGDLHWMIRQHHLFANKFDPQVDDVAIRCLETYLRYKAIHGKIG
ncbi:beta-1,3-galactosyl-O-glycosyl-glycoprotein beta-1,6-N-acetylglucosaminyltransferase 3-like [Scleropages formosus]|uniref:beta-1,3-galactosyl-O-glycosyl-glycoprotein beta-1,6-N-acetylglucosaminyltransferase 3-like n=1 Tax=Scleropages formosus TaxID=113540 RepID=UPI0010FA9922|nr:beta-1,3-galactosyl-O-glycosyl-glycoprotein beta-1,6-N-acetylglucosaminyltransferase 3-like [Scleropages formosus]